jgi:hypothetical protein
MQCVVAALRTLGEEHAAVVEHPFADPSVLVAYRDFYGAAGPVVRGRTLRETLGDLVPLEIVRRRDKVFFDSIFFNRHAREFSAGWDGRDVDERLVDVDALRAEWASDKPSVYSWMLLQSVWLAGETRRVMSAADRDAEPLTGLR